MLKEGIFFLFLINFVRSQTEIDTTPTWKNSDIMVVSKEPLCLDVHFDIAKDLIILKGMDFFDQYFAEVTRHISRILSWHNIRLSIYDVNKWYDGDLIQIGKTVSDAFTQYGILVNELRDTTDMHVLLVNINNTEENLGKAFYGGSCTRDSFAVVQAGERTHWDPMYTATTITHEMGHLLGFDHVTEINSTCKCPWDGFKCLMRPQTFSWNQSLPSSFDSCNMQKLINYPKSCLLDCNYQRPSYDKPICGDNIVQNGEQCDCSFEEACIVTGRNKCCNPGTCTFVESTMQCVDEPCCGDCNFKRGNVCNSKIDECDLDDFCPGNNPYCPNHIRQTGIKCANNTAYCYEGKCMIKDRWCQIMFPNSVTSYSDDCYKLAGSKAVNNCSGISSYNLQNMFCGTGKGVCGQVYCNLNNPQDPFYNFNAGSLKCYTQLDAPNEMLINKVPMGGACDRDMICYEGICMPATKINYKCGDVCKIYEECEGNSMTCKPNDPKWFQLNSGF